MSFEACIVISVLPETCTTLKYEVHICNRYLSEENSVKISEISKLLCLLSFLRKQTTDNDLIAKIMVFQWQIKLKNNTSTILILKSQL